MAPLAAIGPALAAAAPALTVASTAAAVAGAAMSYQAQKEAAKFQENFARQNVEIQTQIGKHNQAIIETERLFAVDALRRDRARKQGDLLAAIGASGLGFGGSPLEVFADNARQSARDIAALNLNYDNQSYNALVASGSAVRREYANIAEAEAKASAAYGTLLGGVGEGFGIGSRAIDQADAKGWFN